MIKYVHDEVVRAWLDGKTIQYLNEGIWCNVNSVSESPWVPPFHTTFEYRIKPESMTYRLALCNNEPTGNYIKVVYAEDDEAFKDTMRDFVRYITDWQEVEV